MKCSTPALCARSISVLCPRSSTISLDESRRHNVVELLRRLQDRFEQVILITHIESVREGLDRVIAVRYDPESGASVVEQTGESLLDVLPLDPPPVRPQLAEAGD